MIDMTSYIAAKSDQLNADDLMDSPRTITITKVTAQADSADQPVSIHYEGGEGRPFKPCKTVRRIMVALWGKDASKYVGRSMTLYRDPTVSFGGMQVGGIRVSHMSHIDSDKTVALLVTRGRKAPFKVKPLVNAPGASQADFSGQLAQLKALATPGNMDALGAKWQDIGADARKALAVELPALKAACEKQAEPEPPADDVPFDVERTDQPAQVNDTAAPFQSWLTKIFSAADEAEVAKIDKDSEFDRCFFTPEQNDELDQALATRRAQLRETVGAK
jgi:hypothetical protein